MPIYEYQCESCEQRTEAIQGLDEPRLTLCPHCGGPLVKLMSAPSFQFKGTGWYVTDYKGKGKGEGKGEGGGQDGGKGERDDSGAKESTASSSASEGKSSTSGAGESSKKGKSEGSTSPD